MEVVHEACWCVCAEQDVLKAPTPIILCVCVAGGCPGQSELVSLLSFGLTSVRLSVSAPASHTRTAPCL